MYTGVNNEVQRDVEERECSPVVAARLCGEQMSNVSRYMFIGPFTTDDGGCENRVSRCKAGSYRQTA